MKPHVKTSTARSIRSPPPRAPQHNIHRHSLGIAHPPCCAPSRCSSSPSSPPLSPPLTAAAPLSLLRRAAAAVGAGGTAADAAAVQWPIELRNLTWTSERGAILLNGQQFHLKGVIWFGLESETR